MREYQYTPLDTSKGEIRLLEIHPGAFDDPINISIFAVPFAAPQRELVPLDRLEAIRQSLPPGWSAYETLDDRVIFDNVSQDITTWDHPDPQAVHPAYENHERASDMAIPRFEALSYTWGERQPEIELQSINIEKVSMKVRPNLLDALKHVRTSDAPGVLWIDAISINQQDLLERSQQVRRMGDIFKCAHRVVVWLGVASSTSSLALSTLKCVADQVEYTKDGYVLPSPECMNKEFCRSYDASSIDPDSASWHAVDELLQRSWFKRLWVVQEVRLAAPSSLVQCGNDTISWSQLRRAVLIGRDLRLPSESPQELTDRLSTLFHLAPLHHYELPIRLLRAIDSLECSDARDKIFGVLGLLPPALSEKIQPDYTQPVQQVRHRAFTAYVECTGSLDILLTAGPSWLPDWSVPKILFGREGRFSCGNSSAHVAYPDPNLLQATGTMEDTVDSCSKPQSNSSDSVQEVVWDLWLQTAPRDARYPTGEPMAEACAWMLSTGYLKDRFATTGSLYNTLEEAQASILSMQENGAPLEQADLLVDPIVGDSFLFKTRKGYFGISIIEVRLGDKVAVLLGCPLPVILREQSDGQHLFVGCVYIHGLMDGEALLGPLPSGYGVKVDSDDNSDWHQFLIDSSTGQSSRSDPRLDPLPTPWEQCVAPDRLWAAAKKVDAFKNRDTGEIMYTDPRMLPAALRARGVPLQDFLLV
ncbi:heterokaryon incompatibility protein-domain-containing protein [Paraphoma chrysanthemicola]|nr:heterokaryon incompatibility protein-domain-containing protein [Paraphoma chrysanthemicola]